jgi:Mycolic acid cyclopropane synthetase
LSGNLQLGFELPARSWIRRYIFPNSVLPSLSRLSKAAEGLFLVEDVLNLGPHYDPTLMAWEKNFREAWPRFAGRYGDRFRRMWRFYLLSCAGAFRARGMQVYSILFRREAISSPHQLPSARSATATESKDSMPEKNLHSSQRWSSSVLKAGGLILS